MLRIWVTFFSKHLLLLGFLGIAGLWACDKKASFSSLEEKEAIISDDPNSEFDGPVRIISWFPKDDVIKLTSVEEGVFGIQVDAIAGKNVKYSFTLGAIENDSGNEGFFQFRADEIPAGASNMLALAKNSVSQDKHTFSLYKNSLPTVKSQFPEAGEIVNANCNDVISQFVLEAEDVDDDTLSFTWSITGSIDNNSLIVATDKNKTSAYLKYNCTNVGSYLITATISDGYEETAVEWSFQISNPDAEEGIIEIVDFTPKLDPVVVTSVTNVTFAISVNSAAGKNVTYDFTLDGPTVQSGSTPFYELQGASLTAGQHVLVARATNSKSSDSHNFNIRKNSPPMISATSPAQLGNEVFCGGSTLTFSATGSDLDIDDLTFSWLVNGTAAPSMFDASDANNVASAIFTPSCSIEGLNSISLRVSDGYDTTDYVWSVTVRNPSVVQIIGYTPLSTPVIINSDGTQLFTITANGKPPLAYSWELDGTMVNGETGSNITLTGAGLTTGNHVLRAIVDDSDSEDEYSFAVIRNEAPVLSNHTPTNADTIKMNYNAIYTFSVDGSDANLSDSITYSWKMDGASSGLLTSSATATGSQAVLSASAAILGNHTISVTASDGRESTLYTWNINVNYFSEACNNLQAGEICTLVGSTQIGDGLDPSDADESQLIRVQAIAAKEDGSGNLFLADYLLGLVYFYNRSGAPLTRVGTVIPAGQLKIVAGTGVDASGTSGNSATDYPLNNPRGLEYDATRDNLYISEYGAHRVVRINTAGIAEIILGTGAATNNAGTNTEGNVATSHVCSSPSGLVYKLATDELFVACYGTHTIKKATAVSSATLTDILGYIVVGALSGGASSAGSNDGTIGAAGAAKTNNPHGLRLDERNGNLVFTEYTGCRVRYINLSGADKTFFNNAVNATSGQVTSLFGTYGTCNSSTVGLYSATKLRNPTDVGILYNGDQSSLLGFFVPTISDDRILYVNNDSSDITIGGRTVTSYNSDYIVGTGSATYTGEGVVGYLTSIYDTYTAVVSTDHNQLIFTDYGNRRIRALDLSINDGEISNLVGNGKHLVSPYDGEGNMAASAAIFNNPTAVRIYNNTLYIGELTNYRIRQVNLTTGELSHVLGTGAAGNPANDLVNSVQTRGVYGMTVVNNSLLFVDNMNSAGANRTCQVRAWNFSDSPSTVFGITIPSNYVYTVVGNYALGCITWDEGLFQNAAADVVSVYYPDDVASNGTVLYVTSYQNSCILKIDAAGVISRIIGDCVNNGNVENKAYNDASVRIYHPKSIAIDPRNAVNGSFFFVDQYARPTSTINYVNLSANTVTIGGIAVPPGYIRSVYSIGSTPWVSGIAILDNQICFSSGNPVNALAGAHNVLCKNRDSTVDQTSLRIGNPTPVTIPGRAALKFDQEGVAATDATLCGPAGISFDDVGNLYIPERCGHVVRMVKKWW